MANNKRGPQEAQAMSHVRQNNVTMGVDDMEKNVGASDEDSNNSASMVPELKTPNSLAGEKYVTPTSNMPTG